MSDRGTPVGYRHMNGYGSHTFSLMNAKNERVWVRFHFKTAQGIKNFLNKEASDMRGINPDCSQQCWFEASEKGTIPKWNVEIESMAGAQAKSIRWKPFDLTKV